MSDDDYSAVVDLIVSSRAASFEADDLDVWTIYKHPKDYPDHYAARRFVMTRPTSDTSDVFLADTLAGIRMPLIECGFTCLPRNESDEAQIVETWL